MKVGFIIVGRLKSTRLKRKILLDLAGKPVIVRMVDRIRTAKLIDEIILATSVNLEDDPLQDFSNDYGISCFRGE